MIKVQIRFNKLNENSTDNNFFENLLIRIKAFLMIKKGQDIHLEVSDLAFGGRGLAKISGYAVFVDGAVEGDLVCARITKAKKSFGEARVLEVITPSAYRVDPVCDYSGVCGGCSMQFIDYDRQLHYKTNHVKEALAHIAMMDNVTVHHAIASESPFAYRNKVEFTCSPERWLMPNELGIEGIEKGIGIGFHAPKSFQRVLDIKKCHLIPNEGNEILQEIRSYIVDSGIEVYDQRKHTGFWRFVTIRHSVANDGWMVNIITSSENDKAVFPLADKLTAKFPKITSVVNNVTARKAGVAFGEFEKTIFGDGFIKEKLGRFEFKISPNSFFQTNTKGAEKLYSIAAEYAGLTGSENVVDLYCGAGTIGIWLSQYAKQVTGVEIIESAVADARMNAEMNGIDNCSFHLGDAAHLLGSVEKPDVMIVDPPRSGMSKDVVRQVIEMAPKRIVYVSCNPATMARDFIELKQYYRINEIQPVDMFPNTYHIEAVAQLDLI